MNLFESSNRTFLGYAGHNEDSYFYLNRSGRRDASRIRNLLESWFARYPLEEQPELHKRFLSSFDAAFFELMIHEMLCRLNCSVIVHPEIPKTSKRPDFCAIFPNGTKTIVEAVLVTDTSADEAAKNACINTLYDVINRINMPEYFINIKWYENPDRTQPSGRRFRSHLEQSIASIKNGSYKHERGHNCTDEAALFSFTDGNFRLEYSLIRKSEQLYGASSVAIGIYPPEYRWGGAASAIFKTVSKKATRYGLLESPYIIAFNYNRPFGMHTNDTISALYGSHVDHMNHEDNAGPDSHNVNGIWHNATAPQNTRLSAVIGASVTLYGLSRSNLCIFQNPWAKHRVELKQLRMPSASPGPRGIIWEEGAMIHELLDLPLTWSNELLDEV